MSNEENSDNKYGRNLSDKFLFYEQGGHGNDASYSRREFFRSFGAGALRTGVITSINLGAFGVQSVLKEVNEKRAQSEEEAGESLARGDLEVRYFARRMSSVALDKASYSLDMALKIIGGYFLGDTSGLVLRKTSERNNILLGMGTGVLGKAIDTISTYEAVEKMEHSKFREYGFGLYFGEQNPLFSRHPSRLEVILKGVPLSILNGLMGGILPFFGRGYLGMSPFIAENNLAIAKAILYGIEIGDGVKSMIEEGANQQNIESYIESFRPSNL